MALGLSLAGLAMLMRATGLCSLPALWVRRAIMLPAGSAGLHRGAAGGDCHVPAVESGLGGWA